MSGISLLLIVWGVVTTVLVALIIYRALVSVHEEDQLFLSRDEAAMAQEQVEVLQRINRVDPLIRWVAIADGALLLFIGSLWLYQGLFTMPAIE